MEAGEEITLLSYDDDLGDRDKVEEPEAEGDDNTGRSEEPEEKPEAVEPEEPQEPDIPKAPPVSPQPEFDIHPPVYPQPTPFEPQPTPTQPYQPQPAPARPYQPQPTPEQPYQPHLPPAQPHQPQPAPAEPHQPQPAPAEPYQPQPAPAEPHLPHPPQQPHQPQPASTSIQPGACDIIASGMNAEMQQYASSLAIEAFVQFPNHLMAVARHIMTNFEQRYGPPWHCFVADKQMGFYMRYDSQNYIYYTLSGHTLFLYKSP